MGLLENTWGSVYMGSGWEVKEAVFRRPGQPAVFPEAGSPYSTLQLVQGTKFSGSR